MTNPANTNFDEHMNDLVGKDPLFFDQQPFYYSTPPFPTLSSTLAVINLVYLDVWQREVTVWEDYALREIALNGPDTATRVQTAWQVKVMQNADASSCKTPPAPWTTLTAASSARLTAQATPAAPAPGPCVINPAGGYTGLENRLYRVEVHSVGTATGVGTLGGATKPEFKWSRDNASLAAKVLSITAVSLTESIITVGSTGRDAWMRFEHDDHLEFIDDDIEFAMREKGVGGPMARVLSVNHATGEIHVDKGLASFPAVVAARHPRIRRWDIATAAEPLTRPVSTGVAIPLEEGITVTFGPTNADTLHAGDYWVFAARTADGTIETLVNAPPRGILHHFAPLALVASGAPPTMLTDCRIPWPPPTGTGTQKEGCCTVVVQPGESIQAAIDSLKAFGGCVCLKVGEHRITEPIRILKSQVTLHGESIGAHVISDVTYTLLIIGSGDGLVTNVDVHDIRFETRGGPLNELTNDPIISMIEVRDVAVHDCAIAVLEQVPVIGIMMVGAEQIRIERNEIDGVRVGVWTVDQCRLVSVVDNYVRNVTEGELDRGAVGVAMAKLIGSCRVTGNRIEGFVEGIVVEDLAIDDDGSFVVGNRIFRKPIPPSDAIWWGIDVQSFGCTIRDNMIPLMSADQGGIRSRGDLSKIENNDIRSALAGLASGIQLDGTEAPIQDGVIRGNYLAGIQDAINVLACSGVQVLDNVIEAPTGPGGRIGIQVWHCTDTLVSGNRIIGAEHGITSIGGRNERLLSNQIDLGGWGIMADTGVALSVADNRIDDMRDFGIATNVLAQTVTVSRNRLARCATSGTSAFPVSIMVLDTLGEVVVESNDALDTGIAGDKLAGTVVGIYVVTARSRIQSNQVTYTRPDKLDPSLECRSLRLDGQRANTRIGDTTNDWALILDNSFIGVGLSALVEINGREQEMLDRVTFADNYCEHYSVKPDDRRATVSVVARNVIAQGNQVKATIRFFSFDFHGIKNVIFMGNITTADIVPSSSTIPTPRPAFNLIV
jgi:hypothetical protein